MGSSRLSWIISLSFVLCISSLQHARADLCSNSSLYRVFVSVSGGNDGTGDGSDTQPFASVAKALNSLPNPAGANNIGVLCLAAGTYVENSVSADASSSSLQLLTVTRWQSAGAFASPEATSATLMLQTMSLTSVQMSFALVNVTAQNTQITFTSHGGSFSTAEIMLLNSSLSAVCQDSLGSCAVATASLMTTSLQHWTRPAGVPVFIEGFGTGSITSSRFQYITFSSQGNMEGKVVETKNVTALTVRDGSFEDITCTGTDFCSALYSDTTPSAYIFESTVQNMAHTARTQSSLDGSGAFHFRDAHKLHLTQVVFNNVLTPQCGAIQASGRELRVHGSTFTNVSSVGDAHVDGRASTLCFVGTTTGALSNAEFGFVTFTRCDVIRPPTPILRPSSTISLQNVSFLTLGATNFVCNGPLAPIYIHPFPHQRFILNSTTRVCAKPTCLYPRWGLDAAAPAAHQELFSCAPCIPGQVVPTSDSVCFTCPAGLSQLQLTDTQCTPCQAGRAASSVGTFGACPACAVNEFASSNGSTACTVCPEGSAVADESTQCVMCPAGQEATARFTGDSGIRECRVCSEDHYSGSSGGSCQACAPLHQADAGAESCSLAPSFYALITVLLVGAIAGVVCTIYWRNRAEKTSWDGGRDTVYDGIHSDDVSGATEYNQLGASDDPYGGYTAPVVQVRTPDGDHARALYEDL